MGKYLFEIEARLDVGFVVAQEYVLGRYPHAGTCFDMATLLVRLWADEWKVEDEDFFLKMSEDGIVRGWKRSTYVEVAEDEG